MSDAVLIVGGGGSNRDRDISRGKRDFPNGLQEWIHKVDTEMKESLVKSGMRIVITDIKTTVGFNVTKAHIANRALHARGTVLGYISGHGGEVYAVEHDVGAIAVYHHSEFEQIQKPVEPQKGIREQVAIVLVEDLEKRKKNTDIWSIDEIETAAIAQMLRDLLFLEDSEKTTGLFPRKRILTKVKRAFKNRKELFSQKFRCYTHRRYI